MLNRRFLRSDELGVKLEIIGGLPIWEAHPVWKHQKAIDRIRATIKPILSESPLKKPGACIHASDVYISFPD